MTTRGKSALLIAGLAVVAFISAPVAGARPTCQDGAQDVGQPSSAPSTETTCQTDGNVSIKATPGAGAQWGQGTIGGFPYGGTGYSEGFFAP